MKAGRTGRVVITLAALALMAGSPYNYHAEGVSYREPTLADHSHSRGGGPCNGVYLAEVSTARCLK